MRRSRSAANVRRRRQNGPLEQPVYCTSYYHQESPVAVSQPTLSPSTFHLRRRTPGSFVLVPFERQGRSIRCQGQLEAAAAVVLANCPLVRSIREQPLSIRYAWRETPEGVQFQLLGETAGENPAPTLSIVRVRAARLSASCLDPFDDLAAKTAEPVEQPHVVFEQPGIER